MNVVTITEFTLAGASIVGGFAGYLNGARWKGLTTTLQDENASVRRTNQDLLTEKASLVAANTQLTKQNEWLKDLATGRPNIAELQTQTAEQHKEVVGSLWSMTKELANIAKAMVQTSGK